jgi:transcriptional regulator with PAS, ATPase and Fis domain
MPVGTQAKLLRVIEDSKVRRLGGKSETVVDVRVIAATNRQPEEAIRKGMLRDDLFYRLNVFGIHLPPLRQRLDDLPLLVEAMINDLNEKHGTRVTSVGSDVLMRLQNHDWPGNVRELRNVLERAVIVTGSGSLSASNLPSSLGLTPSVVGPVAPSDSSSGVNIPVGSTVHQAEKSLILLTLAHTKNNKTRAAEMLGISLKTLFNKLKEYGQDSAKAQEAEGGG